MLKKLFVLALTIGALTACGGKTEETAAPAETTAIESTVENTGGDLVAEDVVVEDAVAEEAATTEQAAN